MSRGVVSTGSTSRSATAGEWSRRARPAGGRRGGRALGRMDAFARRVGFEPRRLPPWLTRSQPDDGPGASDPPVPRFGFDWSKLLPPLTMNLHLAVDDLAAGTGRSGPVGGRGTGHPRASCTSTCDRCTPTTYGRSSTWPARHPSTPTRSPTGIARPCACAPRPTGSRTPPTPAARVDVDHTRPGRRAAPERTAARLEPRPRWAGSTTGSRPTASGRCASPSTGSASGATRTARSTSSTTPAPTRSPRRASRGSVAAYDPEIEVYPTDTVIEVDFGHAG